MKLKILTSVLASLIVLGSASPVKANVIVQEGQFNTGMAQVHYRNMVPTGAQEQGVLDIEYQIGFIQSTTGTVKQAEPDHIVLQFVFDEDVDGNISYEVPSEPANGGSWCGKNLNVIACVLPVEFRKSYRFHLVYRKTVPDVRALAFNTSYNDADSKLIVWQLANQSFIPMVAR